MALGITDGTDEGDSLDGTEVIVEGPALGVTVCNADGADDGDALDITADISVLGASVGTDDGDAVGSIDGASDGADDGDALGVTDGTADGSALGV